MYCSTCGGAVVQGLSYCNHCGGKLNGGKDARKSTELRPEALVWGMVAVLVFGFAAMMFLMMAMKMVGLNVGQILAFTIIGFALMLALEAVFTWQLLSRKRSVAETVDAGTKELDAAQARLLPEPVPSVTEHTTRAFEPIYTERRSK